MCLECSIRVGGKGAVLVPGVTENLSRSGALVTIRPNGQADAIAVGAQIAIDLDLPHAPDEKPQCLRGKGMIVRTSLGEDGETQRVALSFSKVGFHRNSSVEKKTSSLVM